MAQGIDRMVWTFDPLISANAYFNLHKLGAVAHRYAVNYYGAMSDELNRGLESDRLEVDWWLRAPRVEAAIHGDNPVNAWEQAVPVLAARPRGGNLVPGEPLVGREAPTLRVEIPLAFAAVKGTDANLALAWRSATREAFLHYLGRGYTAVNFLNEPSTDPRKGAYLLSATPGADRR
jgi:predicted GNAT superfamily acetyltransferase